jgi:hypothetical protein
MSLRSRLAKLERGHGVGCCPLCRDRDERLTVFGPSCEEADYLAGRVPQPELPPEAAPCSACGWEPTVTVIYEVVVDSAEQARAGDAFRREEQE